MIDKPKGRGEKLLEYVFAFCGRLHTWAGALAGRHPRGAKLAVTVCFVAVFGSIVVGYAMPREVSVYMDDSISTSVTVYKTTTRQVDRFLEAHGIDYVPGIDEIDVAMDAPIEDGMKINISKAFDINITADGTTSTVIVLPMTVEEALAEADITYDEDDIVEPDLDTLLKKGDEIVVKRVVHTEEICEKTIDYQVVYQADSSITIGDVQVTQEGRKGKIQETYAVTYVDGEETERELVDTQTLREKKNKIIGYGTKISFGKPAGLNYEKKYENVRAVSYHISGNPVGSYGLPCEYGTVAVDTDLIPLGSLLYIEGYGYAIANDVGTAIQGKTVDLYMERLDQCMLWGARWTTVYVIDEA